MVIGYVHHNPDTDTEIIQSDYLSKPRPRGLWLAMT
jgi:hypothetical protein